MALEELEEFGLASSGTIALLVSSCNEAELDVPGPLLLGAQQSLPRAMMIFEKKKKPL
jgi:hypothetical protein